MKKERVIILQTLFFSHSTGSNALSKIKGGTTTQVAPMNQKAAPAAVFVVHYTERRTG